MLDLRAALAVAKTKNKAHLKAHQRLQVVNDSLAKAQEAIRTAVGAAALAESEAMASAAEVRRLHLSLGAVTIGMFRADVFSIYL